MISTISNTMIKYTRRPDQRIESLTYIPSFTDTNSQSLSNLTHLQTFDHLRDRPRVARANGGVERVRSARRDTPLGRANLPPPIGSLEAEAKKELTHACSAEAFSDLLHLISYTYISLSLLSAMNVAYTHDSTY